MWIPGFQKEGSAGLAQAGGLQPSSLSHLSSSSSHLSLLSSTLPSSSHSHPMSPLIYEKEKSERNLAWVQCLFGVLHLTHYGDFPALPRIHALPHIIKHLSAVVAVHSYNSIYLFISGAACYYYLPNISVHTCLL